MIDGSGKRLSRRLLLGGLLGAPALMLSARHALAADRQNVASRLENLGISLPRVAPPVASYVPYVVSGDQVFIAGQLPMRDGTLLHPGRVPVDVTVEQAREAARQCAINVLAALNAACDGDLERVRQCVRLQGYVASVDDFTRQSSVMNGASELIAEVFGERGRHTRVAVGASSLPLNACVEVAGLFTISD